jgi:class 3 adenylate cyclase/tetratricopeptide (TPR) repeat protein
VAGTVSINVVFTDLVGSTEMASRLGPEATEELRQVHFGLLRGAIEAHEGREVKNLGDGLMVVFPSLGATMDGSVAMQQAIERHNSSGKEPLGVRVGVSIGDATEEDGDYFGDPVVEAARLCAKCEAGQIITTELISLFARKTGHGFEPIGDLELRGVPEPVASVTLQWEPMELSGEVPIPERVLPDMDFAIAGREQETDQLLQAFKSAETGDRRVTFLAGEPGIGKTRLSSELAVHAHGRGANVLYGRCDEELTVPYQPWVEAVAHLLEKAPDDLLEGVIRDHGPELAMLVPDLRRRHPDVPEAPSTDPETERYRLMQAVTATLTTLAEESALLVVLDDLHWADTPTLTLLRHVVTNVPAAALMLVVTYRDSDLEAGNPLIDTVAALRREPGIESIQVKGLDDLGILALVEASAGQEITGEAREMTVALRQESAGNPFFAHEILRNLVETGDIYLNDDGDWIVAKTFEEMSIPASVRDVVGQRIARLGDSTQKTLTAAAVIGREFDLALLAQVTGDDEDDLLDLVEAAISAGIVVEVPDADERYRFQHALARNTLADELSDGRRRRMHRKVAEALEEAYGADPGDRVGELATHWMAATAPVDASKATHYARLAGQQAEAALAPDEAVRWFTMALESMDLRDDTDPADRAALLVDLGTAQKHSGNAGYRQTLLDASALAEQVGDASLMAASALANNRGFISKLGAVDDERVAALEKAIAAVGEDPSAERALLLATLSGELEYAGELEDRMPYIEEALEIAGTLDDPETVAAVNNRFCMSFAIPHTLADRQRASQESLAIGRDLGDLTITFWAGCGAFQAALAAADGKAARAHMEDLTAAAEEIGRPTFRWIAGCLKGALVGVDSAPDQLEVLATETFAIGEEAGEPDAFDYYGGGLMTVRWIQGRGIEIIDQARQGAADNPKVPVFGTVVAKYLADDGDLDAARELLEERADAGFDLPVNNNWVSTLTGWASIAHLVDATHLARELYDRLVPFVGQVAINRVNALYTVDGTLARLATLLGDHEAAEAHFDAAEQMHASLGARFFDAEEDLARADLHRRLGDSAKATELAERSLASSTEHGFAAAARRATAFLEDLADV